MISKWVVRRNFFCFTRDVYAARFRDLKVRLRKFRLASQLEVLSPKPSVGVGDQLRSKSLSCRWGIVCGNSYLLNVYSLQHLVPEDTSARNLKSFTSPLQVLNHPPDASTLCPWHLQDKNRNVSRCTHLVSAVQKVEQSCHWYGRWRQCILSS